MEMHAQLCAQLLVKLMKCLAGEVWTQMVAKCLIIACHLENLAMMCKIVKYKPSIIQILKNVSYFTLQLKDRKILRLALMLLKLLCYH